ncbi:ParA family protein [Actinomyces naeslundii]|uniref:ParA family protein n=1 Tax=Actinomyces naeslundii TaxID=1655 RepID=UPI00096E4743|nr:ParA family protein [Actinomyces naeslundii]OMG23788.1 hypothetical protein BKH37_02780 [Actinomyces naeslundii]
MPTVVAVANQKGGVGKTSTTVNLAAVCAGFGHRVLVVDADPQANATSIVDVEIDAETRTLNDVLVATSAGTVKTGALSAAIAEAGPAWKGVDIVPAERDLANRDADNSPGREHLLSRAADGALDDYDVVIIDCPPALGSLTLMALTAADKVLIVSTPRTSSVDGVDELVTTINTVRSYYNHKLAVAGILINQWRNDRLDRVVWRDQLRATYRGLVIDHFLPEREVVATAATNHVPVPRKDGYPYIAAMEAVAAHILEA